MSTKLAPEGWCVRVPNNILIAMRRVHETRNFSQFGAAVRDDRSRVLLLRLLLVKSLVARFFALLNVCRMGIDEASSRQKTFHR